jgi:hypothetical protein
MESESNRYQEQTKLKKYMYYEAELPSFELSFPGEHPSRSFALAKRSRGGKKKLQRKSTYSYRIVIFFSEARKQPKTDTETIGCKSYVIAAHVNLIIPAVDGTPALFITNNIQ